MKFYSKSNLNADDNKGDDNYESKVAVYFPQYIICRDSFAQIN